MNQDEYHDEILGPPPEPEEINARYVGVDKPRVERHFEHINRREMARMDPDADYDSLIDEDWSNYDTDS